MKKSIIAGILTISVLFSFTLSASALCTDVSKSIPIAPQKIEYMDETGSIIEQPMAMAIPEGSIVETPETPMTIVRAKETFQIKDWSKNSSHTLSKDKEMVYGEKIKVEGLWNNSNARMTVRCSVYRNGSWAPVSQSSFASGSSTTIAVASSGLIWVEAIPSDSIIKGTIAISYNV